MVKLAQDADKQNPQGNEKRHDNVQQQLDEYNAGCDELEALLAGCGPTRRCSCFSAPIPRKVFHIQ